MRTFHAKCLLAILALWASGFQAPSLMAQAGLANGAFAQGLLFREDWKTTPAEVPISQDHVASKNLRLSLFGDDKDQLKKSHHDKPADDPFYLWSGLCKSRWAFSLRPTEYAIDLTAPGAKVRVRTKQAGDRTLHLLVKTADGRWYISKQAIHESADWEVSQLKIAGLKWFVFNINTLAKGENTAKPALSVIEEIGFTDLEPGEGSKACSRVDWIEVYGERVGAVGP